MKKLIVLLVLLITSYVQGQDAELFKRIDSIVTNIDSMAFRGKMDTLSNGLLNEGGTTSDIFVLTQGRQVQKISVINKSKNYSEKIVFQKGRAIFAQFYQSDGAKWTFYLVDENAFFKDGDKFNKSSGSYWYSMIDYYLDMFKDKIDK